MDSPAGLTAQQQRIKDRYVSIFGTWGEPWETVLRVDPDFVDAYLGMQQVPFTKNHLSDRFKALCQVAVVSAATHLYLPGIRPAIRRALDLGATAHEVVEVFELISTVGIHTMNIGVPLLVEVLVERGRTGPAPLSEYQQQQKEEFTRNRGYWHSFFDELLELDPELFAAYTEFSSVPWRTGPLTPAEKELIYIAYDIAATHLYVPGTKLHMRNALNHGATPEQILEVMEISSMLGIHTLEVAGPILSEELARGSGSPEPH
jgi:alkylhydroperoxidase/carboxymuconolactone decarboxylase family protein YurZ